MTRRYRHSAPWSSLDDAWSRLRLTPSLDTITLRDGYQRIHRRLPARDPICYRELRREEIQEPDPGRQWRVRQRGDAARDACREGEHLCLWQLSRSRRTLPEAGSGNPQTTTRK